MRSRETVVLSILSFGLSGCFTAKKKFEMPTPAPVVAKPRPEPQVETPPDIETEVPRIALEEVALPAPPEVEAPPSRPAQAKRPAPGPITPAPTQPGPATPEVEQPPAPPTPQLGEILTADRRRQYEALFIERVSGAQGALNRANGRTNLTQQQKETIQRIRTFLHQAEETKDKDLVTALEFARRADLFGRDLVKSLQ